MRRGVTCDYLDPLDVDDRAEAEDVRRVLEREDEELIAPVAVAPLLLQGAG